MIRFIVFNTLLFGSCGYALLKGTRDARIVAITCLVATFASYPFMSYYASVEASVMAVDVLTFLTFTAVALRSDRFWPLWISGLQLTTSVGHLVKALDASLIPIAYAVALRLWSYPIQIILAVAVWRGRRRDGKASDLTTA
jgi:hypothetical protein